MNVFGLWLAEAADADFVSELATAGFAMEWIGSAAELVLARDGLVVDESVLRVHGTAVAARRAEAASFPVVAVLPAGADAAAVHHVLAVADEVIRSPVLAVELARRLGLLSRTSALAGDGLADGLATDPVQSVQVRHLSQAWRVESLGRLASGIADEINTPLQYLEGNLEFLAATFGRLVEFLDALGAAALDPGEASGLAATLAGLLANEELRFLLEETPAALRESREGLDQVASLALKLKRFADTCGPSQRTA